MSKYYPHRSKWGFSQVVEANTPQEAAEKAPNANWVATDENDLPLPAPSLEEVKEAIKRANEQMES